MNEKRIIQQEIAPLAVSEETKPLPVDKKENQAAAFFKLKPTQKIVYIAIFVAVAIVLKRFTATIGPGLIVSFLYIPVYLAGSLLGPGYGFAVGGIGDLLGTLWTGRTINLILTFGNATMGAIMGTVFYFRKMNFSVKLVIGSLIALLICTLGINTIGLRMELTFLGGFKYNSDYTFFKMWYDALIIPMYGSPLPRIAFQPLVVLVNLGLTIPAYAALRKISFRMVPA